MTPSEGERQAEEELRAELQWLAHNQAALDARLARVEDSMVFRTLRAIGRLYQTRVARVKTGESRGYAAWREKAGMEARPFPPVVEGPRISLVIAVKNPERVALERAVASVRAQTYAAAELMARLDETATPFARKMLDELKIPVSERVTGEWIGSVGENDFLSPVALEYCVAAAHDGVDLLYTDEDVVDVDGRPLRPIFKPDWSPVLLRSVDYMGGLCLRRAGLAGDPVRVAHIARVLYHSSARALPDSKASLPPSASTPLVSIIVCTRTAALLDRCLTGVKEKTAYPRLELLVVQHLGSSSAGKEASVCTVIERHGARRIVFAEPFNFSAMNNLGALAASGELLLFLNDDVVPLQPDWLERLVGHIEDASVGAVGAKLVYPDGALQHAGITTWLIDGAGHPGRNVRGENWPWLPYTREVTAVTGACLLVRRADFERLGGFDPIFPVNYNDVDLCLRLRGEGFTVIVDMNAVLRHDESQTRRAGTNFAERRLFFRRWARVLEKVDPYYSPHLAQNNEDLSLR